MHARSRSRPLTRSLPRPLVMGALALAGTLALPGCNIIAPAAYLIEGPPKIDARFQLDRERRTVVFIDDSRGAVSLAFREAVGRAADAELLNRVKIKSVVSSADAIEAAIASDTSRRRVTVEWIAAQARGPDGRPSDVVIYADLDGFALSPDGTTFAPQADARVLVFDAATREKVWPTDRDDFPVAVRSTERPTQLPAGGASAEKAEAELAALLGRAIAQLFYEHEIRESAAQGKASMR